MLARVLSAVALAALVFVPAASAHGPKPAAKTARWAKRNHLRGSWRAKDPDHDGLTNLAEFKAGTNPRRADSDHDGLKDGAELQVGDDPLDPDSDGDGVKDGAEHAGVVTAYSNGTLTIKQLAGGMLTATLADAADCSSAGDGSSDDPSSDDSSSDDPTADDTADDSTVDDSTADDPTVDDSSADDSTAGDATAACEDAGLDVGALVRKVELDDSGAIASLELA
jgi:Bacterial TSP3 repeat